MYRFRCSSGGLQWHSVALRKMSSMDGMMPRFDPAAVELRGSHGVQAGIGFSIRVS
jgi:hypothetical protein